MWQAAPAYPSVVAYDKNGLRIVFSFAKPGGASSPSSIVTASFENSTATDMEQFALLVSLPKVRRRVVVSRKLVCMRLTGRVSS